MIVFHDRIIDRIHDLIHVLVKVMAVCCFPTIDF